MGYFQRLKAFFSGRQAASAEPNPAASARIVSHANVHGAEREFNAAVLVVDDDTDVLTCICVILQRLRVPVFRATDGLQALKIFETESPAVVVLDLMIPKRGGFQVLQIMRTGLRPDDRKNPPQVIMITGNEGDRHETFARQNGARDYIRKPFRMQTLVDEVVAAFRDLGVELREE